MLQAPVNNYLIIGERAVQWVPSVSRIPDEEDPPKAVYPVWLMDSLGVRAAVVIRCPTCQMPLGLSPGDAAEQKEWNKKEPVLNSMLGCVKCANIWMITNSKAYHLMAISTPPVERLPRIFAFPMEGGKA